jgi:hypothetical protein
VRAVECEETGIEIDSGDGESGQRLLDAEEGEPLSVMS